MKQEDINELIGKSPEAVIQAKCDCFDPDGMAMKIRQQAAEIDRLKDTVEKARGHCNLAYTAKYADALKALEILESLGVTE